MDIESPQKQQSQNQEIVQEQIPEQVQEKNKTKKKTKKSINPELWSKDLKNWKNQLQNFETDLMKRLNEELPKYTYQYIRLENIDNIQNQAQEIILAPIIDQSPASNIQQSIQICKNELISYNIERDDEQIYNLIFGFAERVNYVKNIKSVQLDNLDNSYIWEIKNPDFLAHHQIDIIDVQNSKIKKQYKQKVIDKLDLLILKIKQANEDSDINKINLVIIFYYRLLIITKKFQLALLNQKLIKLLKKDKQNQFFLNYQKENVKISKKLKDEQNNSEDSQKNEPQKKKKVSKKSQKSPIKQIENIQQEQIQQQVQQGKIKYIIEIKVEQKQEIKNQPNIFEFFQKKVSLQKSNSPQKNIENKIIKVINEINKHIQVPSIQETIKQQKIQKIQNKYKYYLFHDSVYQQKKKKSSYNVTFLKPLEKDLYINYDIDSDDEIELRDAEDCENISELEEDSEQESSIDGFLVPDGYLSNDEESLQNNQPKMVVQQHKLTFQQYFFDFKDYQEGKDKAMDEQVDSYKILNIQNLEFPIKIQKEPKQIIQKEQELTFFQIDQNLIDFIKHLHGSYSNRQILIDQFNTLHPEISKSKLLKKLAEITKKCKLSNDKKERFYINQEILDQYDLNQVSDELLKQRYDELIQKQQDQKILMKQMQQNEKQIKPIIINEDIISIIEIDDLNSNTNKQKSLDEFFIRK